MALEFIEVSNSQKFYNFNALSMAKHGPLIPVHEARRFQDRLGFQIGVFSFHGGFLSAFILTFSSQNHRIIWFGKDFYDRVQL